MSQANTREGDILPIAAEDLSKVADILLTACEVDGELGVRRPSGEDDLPLYVLIYGASKGKRVNVRPLAPHRSVRLLVRGIGRPGTPLAPLIDGTGRVVPAERDDRWLVGVAEESFTDGQFVKVRPL